MGGRSVWGGHCGLGGCGLGGAVWFAAIGGEGPGGAAVKGKEPRRTRVVSGGRRSNPGAGQTRVKRTRRERSLEVKVVAVGVVADVIGLASGELRFSFWGGSSLRGCRVGEV